MIDGRHRHLQTVITAALLACAGPVFPDSLQQDMELAAVAHIQATRELDAVRSKLRDAESLHPIRTAELSQLKGILQGYASRLRAPSDQYSAAFADFAQAYRRAFWDPIAMDPEGQTRLALALFHASTLRRKDESWMQNLMRLSDNPAYPFYRALWTAMGWRANTLERDGAALMEAEHALRQTRQTLDAEIRADESIAEAGGGYVTSLDELRRSVTQVEDELRELTTLIANLRQEERDLLERLSRLQSRLDQLAEERRRRDADTDRAEQERRRRNEETRRQWAEQQAPAPPTATPVVQVKVDPAFVEAAEPQGPDGLRTRTYRFYLLVEETAKAPAKLRLNWLRTDPLLPHRTEPSAYTRRPDPAYSLRPGEIEPLRAWEAGDTILSVYSLLAGVGPDFKSRWAGGAKHLGPFYLTAGEKEKYWGVFTAEIQVLDASDQPTQTLQVRWEPFPRPAQPLLGQGVKLTLSTPSARDMGGPWQGGSTGVGGRLVAFRLHDLPPDLTGGLYWLEVDIERVGTTRICALHRQGERELYLQAYLPVPLGRFNLTLRCPQLPGMPPSTLVVQRFLPPDRVENQKKSLQERLHNAGRLQAAVAQEQRNPRGTPERIAYRQADLADNLGSAAHALCNLGEYRQALDLIHKAYALLPERGGISMQLAARGRIAEVGTVAAFESADVPGFLAATRRLIHAREDLVAEALRLNRSPQLSLSSLYDAHALQADGMLVLTGDLRCVQATVPHLRELHRRLNRSGTLEETVTRTASTYPCLRAAILTSDSR